MVFLHVLRLSVALNSWTVAALCAVGAAAFAAFVIYGFNLPNRWRYRGIPGPPPSWLLGTLPTFIKQGFHKSHFELQRKYGPVMKVFLGRAPIVMVADPDQARKVLLKNADRKNPFSGAALARNPDQVEFDKASLINSGAEKAKGLRGAWQPTFNPSAIAEYTGTMNKAISKLLARLQKAEIERSEVNIWRLFGDLTFDVVGTCAFGVDFNTQDPEALESGSDISKNLVAASAMVFKRGGIGQAGVLPMIGLVMPFLVPFVKPIVQVMEKYNIMPKATSDLMKAIDTIRTEAMTLTTTARSGAEDSKCPLSKSLAPTVGSFLSRIINHKDTETNEPLSNPAVAAQAMLFMLAGYETTANTLAFSLYNLARFPEVEQRLIDEVDAFGCDRQPCYEDLQQGNFPYIEGVIRETLRMYPPATATAIRTLSEDTKLGNFLLPRGTNVMVNILALHHDDKLWPEPCEFRPERFIKDSPGYVPHHPYAHLPFGAGARQCIGSKFAMEEATLALVRFYQKFTFELSPGQVPLELGTGTTQGPKDGVFGKIHMRPKSSTEGVQESDTETYATM